MTLGTFTRNSKTNLSCSGILPIRNVDKIVICGIINRCPLLISNNTIRSKYRCISRRYDIQLGGSENGCPDSLG
jgi:hypothetical protein